MVSQFAVVNFLLEEASELPKEDNPLKGSAKEPGDLPVGTLLEEEWKLFRLAAHYHDIMTAKVGVQGLQFISEETKTEIDRLSSLHRFIEELVHKNVSFRLGWKYPKLGFLEDGTIVSFIGEVNEQTTNLQTVVVSEPIFLGGDKSKMN